MRILGLDPGLATIGFAILDVEKRQRTLLSYGVIKTAPHLSLAARLKEIHSDMGALLKKYQPTQVAVEQLFYSKNITTGISVSHARGVILLALEEAGLLYEEFTPSELKRALTGDGNADKKAMQKMLQLELQLKAPPKPDDAADALALALCLAAKLRYGA